MKLSTLSLSLLALAGVAAFAEGPVSPTVTPKAGATILTSTTVERVPELTRTPGGGVGKVPEEVNGTHLYFGRFLRPTTTYTVTLKPDATYDSSASSPDYKGGAYTPGYRLISALNNADVKVAVSEGSIVITKLGVVPTNASTTQKMTVGAFTYDLHSSNIGVAKSALTGQFITSNTGRLEFTLGASLTLNKDQEDGAYQGSYTLTTVFN